MGSALETEGSKYPGIGKIGAKIHMLGPVEQEVLFQSADGWWKTRMSKTIGLKEEPKSMNSILMQLPLCSWPLQVKWRTMTTASQERNTFSYTPSGPAAILQFTGQSVHLMSCIRLLVLWCFSSRGHTLWLDSTCTFGPFHFTRGPPQHRWCLVSSCVCLCFSCQCVFRPERTF